MRPWKLRLGSPIWPLAIHTPLKWDRAGQFALSLAGGARLVFSAAQNPCPTHADGSIDWSQITTVCIEFLGDYHG